MKIRVWLSTNKVGSKVETVIDVPDDADEQEIEAMAQEAMFGLMSWSYEKIDESR